MMSHASIVLLHTHAPPSLSHPTLPRSTRPTLSLSPQIITTTMRTAAIATFASLASLSAAAPAHFEVKSLPGWNGPLLSKAYCGFSSAGVPPSGEGEMFFNYIFIEKEGGSTKDTPTIVWYNGGPGAASMFGLFVELGPYYLNQDSLDDPNFNKTGIPQIQYNPYAWTQVANVIAVNNPPPIGFSYCNGQTSTPGNDGPSGDGYSCGPWNDTTVSRDVYDDSRGAGACSIHGRVARSGSLFSRTRCTSPPDVAHLLSL